MKKYTLIETSGQIRPFTAYVEKKGSLYAIDNHMDVAIDDVICYTDAKEPADLYTYSFALSRKISNKGLMYEPVHADNDMNLFTPKNMAEYISAHRLVKNKVAI